MKNNHLSSFTEELEARVSSEQLKICPICQTEFINPSKLKIHLQKYKLEDLIEASSFSKTSSRRRNQSKTSQPVVIDEDEEIEDFKKKRRQKDS